MRFALVSHAQAIPPNASTTGRTLGPEDYTAFRGSAGWTARRADRHTSAAGAVRASPLGEAPAMTVFSKILASDLPEMRDALEIYTDSFPANERHPADVIRERARDERYRVIVGREQNEIVFFAMLRPLRGSEFVLLDYMATKSRHRGQGVGAAFLKSVAGMAEVKGKFLLMEIEDPARGENREERARRVEFYRRQGAKQLQGVRYLMPGLSGGAPTEMILMVLPPCGEGEIDAMAVRRVVIQIYKELYNRDREDSLLNSFVNEIAGGRITLGP